MQMQKGKQKYWNDNFMWFKKKKLFHLSFILMKVNE